jgi:DNA-binding Lrp family transcriptional regulator
MTTTLDDIDLKILHDLQEDGRLTNVELAKRCHISAPPCLRRVRQLEDANIIQGYHATINPAALGYGVLIFAQVTLKSQSDAELRDFEATIQKWPVVRECYLISGGSDYFLKIYAKDWDDYQNFYSNTLTKCESIAQTKTFLVIRGAKHEPGIPLEDPQATRNIVRSLKAVAS